ncbi:MAG: sigma-70 family RNA polymerase sigma factor [Gemmatimonadota bacterium]|jgi:RNA polymerase sigma-70 factor (ECF subfamily)
MATRDASDRDLSVRITRDGDEGAFRALYRRHTPSLYPFVLRILGHVEADAEDAVQDTWLKAVRALPRFRWESSFRTWLLGIGLNVAREALRRRARSDGANAGRREAAVLPPPTAARLDLERAIASLPEGYRTVLLLHDVEGFTHPEISDRLDIAIGTSRSQLHHARRALRRMLEPSETGP